MNTKTRAIGIVLATVSYGMAAGPGSSNIDPTNKWSWSENIGHMNWRDAGNGEGVVVQSDHLAGTIWLENAGFMNVGNGNAPYNNTDNSDFGVNILPNGDLEGYAWSENLGWANFGWAANTTNANRARFDEDQQRFRGWLWLENAGWVNLDDEEHFVSLQQPDIACTRDCDCYIEVVNQATDDGADANTLMDVCDYTYCDIPMGETEGNCTSCTRRYGNTCSSFGGIVQTSDILCAVSGFGDYCSCPNGDLIDTGATGCDPGNIDGNCKGPSGVPITTADILAVVAAFGGDNPFTCSVPDAATCDSIAPPTPDGCGTSAASEHDDAVMRKLMMREPIDPFTTATISIEPRTKLARPGSTIDIDVFITNASGIIGYEFGLNAFDAMKQFVGVVGVSVDTQRRDYIFSRFTSFPAIDIELSRIGGVVMDAGVSTPPGKRAYIGSYTLAIPETAMGVITLQPLVEFVALYGSAGQQTIDPIKDATIVITDKPTRR